MKIKLKKTIQILVFSVFTISPLLGQSSVFKRQVTYETLSQTWELGTENSYKTFLITSYKPVYVLPFRFSTNRIEAPFVVPDEEIPAEKQLELNNVEATLQLSLKTKVAQRILGEGSLWLGYTQKSYWQVYNAKFSRPFRETNYEPELIFNYPIKSNFLGLKTKMLGLAFNHQSNGREGKEFTRSWNRIILQAGFEDKQWNLMLRTWVAAEINENPDIKNYMGRGDATFNYRIKKQLFTLKGQHSLRTGSDNRGNIELDWAFPILGNLTGYFQFFHGYGDAMIDYDQIHTIGGIGVIFAGNL